MLKFISKLSIFLLCLFFFTKINSSEYIKINHLSNFKVGMFSVFSYVTGVLYHFDNESYEGVEVDFEKNGLYYDPSYGPNWWEYFCEPIHLGKMKSGNIKMFNRKEYAQYAFFVEKKLSRFDVYNLIQKHIKIKESIKEKVDSFVQQNFSDFFIITLHYRGTDKRIEAPRIAYAKVVAKIKKYVTASQLVDYKIFVATDEEKFLNFMKKEFHNQILACDCIRSKNGYSVHNADPSIANYKYQIGEDALIDCLLLSQGNILFRTSSNLSLWSTYFNPSIPVIELSRRK